MSEDKLTIAPMTELVGREREASPPRMISIYNGKSKDRSRIATWRPPHQSRRQARAIDGC